MKKYLICSDIHERDERFANAVKRESPLDAVIVAGDLELDSYEITEIVSRFSPKADVYMVCGNCDAYIGSASMLPSRLAFDIHGGHKVFLTHGHMYRNADLTTMSYAAQEAGCDIVIFGHTHSPLDLSEYGLRFLNGGAIRNNTYKVMTVSDDGKIEVEQR